MSSLQPKGIPFEIGGVKRKILFTLAAVDEIQEKYDLPVSRVIAKMAEEREVYATVASLATILINDEIRRDQTGEKEVTEQEVKWMLDVPAADALVGVILRSYGYSLPQAEEEDPK